MPSKGTAFFNTKIFNTNIFNTKFFLTRKKIQKSQIPSKIALKILVLKNSKNIVLKTTKNCIVLKISVLKI